MAIFLSAADVRELLTVEDALAAAEQGYRIFGEERKVLSNPSAAFMVVPNPVPTMFWIKGAFSRTLGVAGVSYGCQFGEYYFLVTDSTTGMLRGVVERALMSKRRTGCTAGVVARKLARPGSRVAAMVGAGLIGEQVARALAHVLDLDDFRIAARSVQSASRFVDRLQPELGAPMRAVATPEEAVRGADVVVTITVADAPFLKPGWLKKGALVVSMGGVPEIDFGVLKEVDRLVVDDLDYAMLRGDLASWVDAGAIARSDLENRVDADVGEIFTGEKPGRTDPDETILAVIQGLTLCDLVTASQLLDKAEESRRGLSWQVSKQLDIPEERKQSSGFMSAGIARRRPSDHQSDDT